MSNEKTIIEKLKDPNTHVPTEEIVDEVLAKQLTRLDELNDMGVGEDTLNGNVDRIIDLLHIKKEFKTIKIKNKD